MRTVYLKQRDYDIFIAIVEDGLTTYKELSVAFNLSLSTLKSIMDRLRCRLNVQHVSEMIYKYYTHKLCHVLIYEEHEEEVKQEILQYKEKLAKTREVIKKEKTFTAEQVRRMERMRKMGFTDEEILEEIKSERENNNR